MPTAGLPITILAGTLPPGAVYNAQTYFDAIVARMQASITSDAILWGQLGGSQPPAQLPSNGLWFGTAVGGNGYWNYWDTTAGQYLPIPCVIGNLSGGNLFVTTIQSGAVTRNWVITTPDNGGVMALTSNLVRQFGETIGSTPTFNIDWSLALPVFIPMSANVTITHSNMQQGGMQDLFLENISGSAGSTYTITSPGVWWPGGTAPTLSRGISGTANPVDHIRFNYISGAILGELVQANMHA